MILVKRILIGLFILLLILLLTLPNDYSGERNENRKLREQCEADNGTFARSIDPVHSLCYLTPKKQLFYSNTDLAFFLILCYNSVIHTESYT